MQCDEIYMLLLSGHLDGTNSEAEEKRLEKHLKQCRRCRELLAVLEENDAQLSQELVSPPPELTARIMDAVRQEPKRKPRKKGLYFSLAAAGLATAAMLCFALTGGQLSLPETAKDNASYFSAENKSNASLVISDSGHDSANGELSTEAPQQTESYEVADPYVQELPSQTAEDPVEKTEPPVTRNPDSHQDLPEEILPPLVLPSTDDESTPKDDTLQTLPGVAPHRKPITTDGNLRSVPTLVIWGVSAQELSALDGASSSPLALSKTGSTGTDLYNRFFSALFSSHLERDSKLAASLDTEIYRVPYATLQELFEECWSEYEIALYLPREISETCQIILVSAEAETDPIK